MGRDLIRHQQPLARRAPVWAPYAALAVVLAVAGFALWRAAASSDENGGSGSLEPAQAFDEGSAADGSRDDRAGGADAAKTGAAAISGEGEDGASARGYAGADEPSAQAPAARGALDALAGLAERGAAESSQRWVCAEGLVNGAREALEAYRENAGVSLLAYGYLDVSGNVRGAVLACPGEWVDLLVAQELQGGEEAEITVARFSVEAVEGQGL